MKWVSSVGTEFRMPGKDSRICHYNPNLINLTSVSSVLSVVQFKVGRSQCAYYLPERLRSRWIVCNWATVSASWAWAAA